MPISFWIFAVATFAFVASSVLGARTESLRARSFANGLAAGALLGIFAVIAFLMWNAWSPWSFSFEAR